MRRPTALPTSAMPLLAALLLLPALGCGRGEEATTGQARTPAETTPPVAAPAPDAFAVESVELGSAVDEASQIRDAKTTFAPSDTIYAAVETGGAAPEITLTARWTYEDGQLVNESSRTIAPSGDATTLFEISKPSGWPAGRYQVEIVADGRSAATRSFEVR